MKLTTRTDKGSKLSIKEMDDNLLYLESLVDTVDLSVKVDKETGKSLLSDTEITRLVLLNNNSLTTESFTFGTSQSFVLANDVLNIISVNVQTRGLHPSQYTLQAPKTILINDTLVTGDKVTVTYNYASVTQAQLAKMPIWSAGAYATSDQVNHLGKDWTANAATIAGDEPSISTKWAVRLSAYEDKASLSSGKNLFDKAKVTDGYYINDTNGTNMSHPNYFASGYITISANTSYVVSGNQDYHHAWYDVNKVFISGFKVAGVRTSPANAVYIRMSDVLTKKDTNQLEVGTEPTFFEAYGLYIPEKLIDGNVVRKIDLGEYVKQSSYTYFSINKLTSDTIIEGFKMSNGATAIVADSDSKIGKIPVRDFNKWYIGRPTGPGYASVSFFTNSDVFISQLSFGIGFFYPPANTEYIIINLQWDGGVDITDSTIIGVSDKVLSYQPPENIAVEYIGDLPMVANKISSFTEIKEVIANDALGTNINKNWGLTTENSIDFYSRTYGDVVSTTNQTLKDMGIVNVVRSKANFYYKVRDSTVDFHNKYVQAVMYVLASATEIDLWAFKFYTGNLEGDVFVGPILPLVVTKTLIETGLYEVRFSAKITNSTTYIKNAIWIGGGVDATIENFAGGFLLSYENSDISNTIHTKFFQELNFAHKSDINANEIKSLQKDINVSKFLQGKKFNMLGDSITYGHGVGTSGTYAYLLASKNSMDYVSYGVSGTRLSNNSTDANAMVNRYTQMRDGADIVGVYGGTNDPFTTANIGIISDSTNDTFYGSLHVLCAGLLTKYPTSRIFFIAPARYTTDTNMLLLNKAITEVCELYGIPVLDLAKEGGIYPAGNVAQSSAYYSDAKHPNISGHQRMARVLESFLVRISS